MNKIPCPVCGTPLRISQATSRKAKKPKQFLMVSCSVDGRHFRGFINDREFVSRVVGKAEELSRQEAEVTN
jgi:hypothetical protein